MFPTCNTSDGKFDCSSAFEGIPLPISVIQAGLAFAILVVSIFFNILLSVAIITYHRFLEKSLIVFVSILLSNTIVSVFFHGGVFLTALSQTWLLGYWGCQVFGLMAIGGSLSRWILVGLLSVDQFCCLSNPFQNARQGKKVLIGLLVGSWTASLVITGIYGHLEIIGFDLSSPGCFIGTHFFNLNNYQKATVAIVLFSIIIFGAVLPCVLYSRKAKFFKYNPEVYEPATQDDPMLNQDKRATFTLFGLVKTSIFFSSIIIANITAKVLLFTYSYDIYPAVCASILYILSSLYRCIVIADLAVILSNSDAREALGKMKKAVIKKFKSD